MDCFRIKITWEIPAYPSHTKVYINIILIHGSHHQVVNEPIPLICWWKIHNYELQKMATQYIVNQKTWFTDWVSDGKALVLGIYITNAWRNMRHPLPHTEILVNFLLIFQHCIVHKLEAVGKSIFIVSH